ncbi:hypothetical protein AB0K00_25055 [Dactylosporangium sp. NPDC049525]|uniref:hypothetical protein n=1 Tax=Dactylosporangium sp. NPDC049525 TaxID=3154730 RepID=UPI00343E28FB
MYDFVGGAAIARNIRSRAAQLSEVGFELIEIDGQDHIGALAATDVVAPLLIAALAKAGW